MEANELPLIPTEKNFKLSKVKLNPSGGLQVEYQITTAAEGETFVIDRSESRNNDIHPDLKALFERLTSFVGQVFNITAFVSFLSDFPLTDEQRESLGSFVETLLQKIEVRGISWSGADDNLGVIITAVYETANGLKTCINTPRIKLSQISFGFEEELESIVVAIKCEVYKFLFQGKQAQLSLFGESSEGEIATEEERVLMEAEEKV